MTEYRVTWEIDIDADSPEEAAMLAYKNYFKPEHSATCFLVIETDQLDEEEVEVHFIDLDEKTLQ
jgi:hypothetical protein